MGVITQRGLFIFYLIAAGVISLCFVFIAWKIKNRLYKAVWIASGLSACSQAAAPFIY
jgi:uncharacterized membrane protein